MTLKKIGFYGHVRQYHNLKAEIDAALLEVLESGNFVLGSKGKQFERELAVYLDMKEAVGVNSGTDALMIALHAAEPTTAFTPGARILFQVPRGFNHGWQSRAQCRPESHPGARICLHHCGQTRGGVP